MLATTGAAADVVVVLLLLPLPLLLMPLLQVLPQTKTMQLPLAAAGVATADYASRSYQLYSQVLNLTSFRLPNMNLAH